MKRDYIADDLQRLIRKRFPAAIVLPSTGLDTDEYDIFRIPDNSMGEYARFRMDELPEDLEKLRLDYVVLLAHSESDMTKYYAERIAPSVLEIARGVGDEKHSKEEKR